MALLCAACLLVARLASSEDPPAPVATTEAVPATDVAPPREVVKTAAAPRATRLALRDPFEHGSWTPQHHPPVSPDLIDPFTRPARAPGQNTSRDLRDPFVEGVVRRCVPLQRPRALEPTTTTSTSTSTCAAIDTPLRNPFVAPVSAGSAG